MNSAKSIDDRLNMKWAMHSKIAGSDCGSTVEVWRREVVQGFPNLEMLTKKLLVVPQELSQHVRLFGVQCTDCVTCCYSCIGSCMVGGLEEP